ncbi:unnamed protein product [Camellia sinensis]
MREKRLCSWWCLSSSSLKLFGLIVPLILVSGFVGLVGPNNSNWVFDSNKLYPLAWSSVIPSSSSSSSSSSAMFVGLKSNSTRDSVSAKEEHLDAVSSSDESIPYRSSPPPLPINPIHKTQPPVQKNEASLNTTTISAPQIVPSTNESHTIPPTVESERKPSNLNKLEASLGRVRAAIRVARNNGNQTHDPEDVPGGPMYWNANAFHRSYMEMEKQFKVFVYEEGEPPIFHNGPCKSIYAMEGNFIYRMEVSKFCTRDPDKAHVFFLPFSVTSMVRFIYVRESHDWALMKQTVSDYVNLIARKYHYWNRSLGADHFMLACHDWGQSFLLPFLTYTKIPFGLYVMQTPRKDSTPRKMYHFQKSFSRMARQIAYLEVHPLRDAQSWFSSLEGSMAQLGQFFSIIGKQG